MSGFDPDLFTPIESKEDAWYEKAPMTTSSTPPTAGSRSRSPRRSTSDRSSLCAPTSACTATPFTERVEGAIAEAQALLETGHPGSSTSLAHTAVEIIVRDLVVRSILHGAFLSDRWAEILARQIVRDSPGEPRKLLPLLAEAWELDIDEARLTDGAGAWARSRTRSPELETATSTELIPSPPRRPPAPSNVRGPCFGGSAERSRGAWV